jgi:hypothetical protein
MASVSVADMRDWVAIYASLQKGSHYLWGTAGNTLTRGSSGELNGVQDGFTSVKRCTAFGLKLPTAIPSPIKPNAARECWGVDAAFSTTGGQHVCCGRFRSVPMGTVATYFSNPARANKLLATYLEFRASRQPFMKFTIDWMIRNRANLGPGNPGPQPFFTTLTPRIGFATTDAVATVHQQLIWGESCEDVKHFDCVGLVNGCYASICAWPDITFEIWGWASASVTQHMPEGTDVLPGDIVCVHSGPWNESDRNLTAGSDKDLRDKWHHIGICAGDPDGTIIQAEEGPVGVTVTPNAITRTGKILKGSFNYRGRVPDATLNAWRTRGDAILAKQRS